MGYQGMENLDKLDCLGLLGDKKISGSMKVRDMVLKQAIEQRRADSGRTSENLG